MDVDGFLSRVIVSTGLATQAALADKLGVRPASITDAKKRGIIPADWLIKLARLYGLNPLWLADGQGPKHIESVEVFTKSEVERDSSHKLLDDDVEYTDASELPPIEFWKLLISVLEEISTDSIWAGWYQIELGKRFPELMSRLNEKRDQA